jgi:hypothetical protein
VLTAKVYRPGIPDPVSFPVQACKITWDVWEEVYIIERTRAGGSSEKLPAIVPERAIRLCTEVTLRRDRPLLIGTSTEVPLGSAIYLKATAQVNPVSQELLEKIKRWVSRPSGTGTASPGDALFSTFTGLFLQRLGNAERELTFTTKTVRPPLPKPRRSP